MITAATRWGRASGGTPESGEPLLELGGGQRDAEPAAIERGIDARLEREASAVGERLHERQRLDARQRQAQRPVLGVEQRLGCRQIE